MDAYGRPATMAHAKRPPRRFSSSTEAVLMSTSFASLAFGMPPSKRLSCCASGALCSMAGCAEDAESEAEQVKPRVRVRPPRAPGAPLAAATRLVGPQGRPPLPQVLAQGREWMQLSAALLRLCASPPGRRSAVSHTGGTSALSLHLIRPL